MQRSTLNIIAGSVVVAIIALAVWQSRNTEDAAAKQAVSAQDQACSDEKLPTIHLVSDATGGWQMPLAEMLRLPGSQVPDEPHSAGDRMILLADLLAGEKDFSSVHFLACTRKNIIVDASEIASDPGRWLLRPNRKGYLRLLRKTDDGVNYSTRLRFINRIELH